MLNRTSNPYLIVSVFALVNLYFYFFQNSDNLETKCEGKSEEKLDFLFSKMRDAGSVLHILDEGNNNLSILQKIHLQFHFL